MSRFLLTLFIALVLASMGTAFADELDQVQVRLFKAQMSMAQSGDPDGQYYVGEMYEKGLGTPQDLKAAHEWYEKAAKQGNQKAKNKLASWDKELQDAAKARQEAAAAAAAKAEERDRAVAEAAAKARERIAEEKARQQAAAAARAKERQHAEAIARAKEEHERAVAQRLKEQAAAAAAAKAQQHLAARSASTTTHAAAAAPASQKPAAISAKGNSPAATKTKSGKPEFSANPCKGPSAKFLSTCQ